MKILDPQLELLLAVALTFLGILAVRWALSWFMKRFPGKDDEERR